ncbi:MAG: four helix bundle protein [Pseudomonadota bacterium]|nr:four helix bundle protein [Pseudomonadota bacterium]
MNGEREKKKDLRERTKSFALRIIRLYSALPDTAVAQVIGKQVLRSGTSVGANYREAFRARSKNEFAAKLGDCLKELEETIYWSELLKDSEILTAEKLRPLYKETNELTAIMVKSIKTARSQKVNND